MSAKKVIHTTHRVGDPSPKAVRRKAGHRRWSREDVYVCAIHGVQMQRVTFPKDWRMHMVCPMCHKAAQPTDLATLAGKRKKRDRRGQSKPR
jgi:hypothetical protein